MPQWKRNTWRGGNKCFTSQEFQLSHEWLTFYPIQSLQASGFWSFRLRWIEWFILSTWQALHMASLSLFWQPCQPLFAHNRKWRLWCGEVVKWRDCHFAKMMHIIPAINSSPSPCLVYRPLRPSYWFRGLCWRRWRGHEDQNERNKSWNSFQN